MYRTGICAAVVFGLLQAPQALAAPTLAPKGWECLAAPDNLNKPGRVFYIENGTRFELGDFSANLPVTQSDVASGQWVEKGKLNVSLFLKILNATPVSGNADANLSKTYNTSVTLGHRHLLTTDEGPILKALRQVDPSLLTANRKYYVIRNTQVADTVTITVDRAIAAALGGDIKFKNLVELSGANPSPSDSTSSGAAAAKPAEPTPVPANTAIQPGAGSAPGNAPVANLPATPANSVVSGGDAKAYTIQANFTPPATVCILAQRFTSKTVFGGAGGSVRNPTFISEYWTPHRN